MEIFLVIDRPKREVLVWKWGESYKLMSLIKEATPPDAVVKIPRASPNPALQKLKYVEITSYFLFPRRVIPWESTSARLAEPTYEVKDQASPPPASYVNKKPLQYGMILYDLGTQNRDQSFATGLDFTEVSASLTGLGLTILRFLLIVLSGTVITAILFKFETRVLFWIDSFLCGAILITIAYLILSFCNISFSDIAQWTFLTTFSVIGLWQIKRRCPYVITVPKLTPIFPWQGMLLVGFFFVVLFQRSYHLPLFQWDACGAWGAKAKAIYAFHNLSSLRWFGYHIDYPPLFPVLMAQFALGGEATVMLLFPLFGLCLYALLRESLSDSSYSSTAKNLLPLLILSCPLFVHQFINGYANNALSVFVLRAFISLSMALKKRTLAKAIEFSIVLIGAILVRPDGILFLIFFCATLLICCREQILTVVALPLGSFVLWNLYRYNWLSAQMNSAGLVIGIPTLDTIRVASKLLFKYTFSFSSSGLGFVPPVFLLLAMCFRRWIWKFHRFEFLFIAISYGGIALLMCLQPVHRLPFLFSVGFPRYIMPIIPLMLILIFRVVSENRHGIPHRIGGLATRDGGAKKAIQFEVMLLFLSVLCLASFGLISQIYHTGGKLYQALTLWSRITSVLNYH